MLNKVMWYILLVMKVQLSDSLYFIMNAVLGECFSEKKLCWVICFYS